MRHLDHPVLMTGASGTIGRMLTNRLRALGWRLRLTDLVPPAEPVPQGCVFEAADLEDAEAMGALLADAVSFCTLEASPLNSPSKRSWVPTSVAPFTSTRSRVVMAPELYLRSSNHAFGLYDRVTRLDDGCLFRPEASTVCPKPMEKCSPACTGRSTRSRASWCGLVSASAVPDERIFRLGYRTTTWLLSCSVAQRASASDARSSGGRPTTAEASGAGTIGRGSGGPFATVRTIRRPRFRAASRTIRLPNGTQGGQFVSRDFSRRDFAPSVMFTEDF